MLRNKVHFNGLTSCVVSNKLVNPLTQLVCVRELGGSDSEPDKDNLE